MLRCRDIAKLLSDSLEKDLPWLQRVEIRMHLMICYVCRRYWKQLRFLHGCMRRYYEEEHTCEKCLSQEAKERIQNAIDEESKKI